MAPTNHAWTRWVWVLIALACGCGDRPSSLPIAPGTQSPAAYHIVGTVMDKLSRRLAGAVVTIVDGPLAGTTTRSDDGGRFEFKANLSGRRDDGCNGWLG